MQNIALHGVPRSGTSWVGAIFDSSENVAYRHQPLFSYAFKSYLDENASKEDIERFFERILDTDDDFVLQKEGKARGSIPAFKKGKITHVVYKEARYHYIMENMLQKDGAIKVVGIVRNPKSVLSSWYNAPKEFEKGEWNLLEQWKDAGLKNQARPEEFYGYNKWKEVSLLFLRLQEAYPTRFYLLRYADLLRDVTGEVQRLFAFCGLGYSKQTADFLARSQAVDLSEDAYSVFRKNQIDDKWKAGLPQEIVEAVDKDLSGSVLEQFNEG